jgi:DNA repair protein RadD
MLRDVQLEFKNNIYGAWNEGAQYVMGVAPTGFGKTVVMGSVVQDFDAPTCAIAHRQELVSQISLAFNREEVPHGIIAPKSVIREIIAAQMESHGRSYYNPRAHVRVAGVDSLKLDPTDRWFSQVQLVLQDEGHHVLRENKWGQRMGFFPSARGLFLTAHALRADGRGLGRGADGLVDRLVVGPSCRATINRGYLTDYRLICPGSDVDTSDLKPGDSGELNQREVAERVHASNTIVGDVVKHYRKFADGELGITFAVDVAACHEIKAEYEKARIPAAIITAKTPIGERAHIMKQYRQRQIIQLVNVDCLGEGTDVPACTVVSMARPSASFQLVAQQFGRMLRVLVNDDLARQWHTFTDEQRLGHIAASSKPMGICIDHVGNIAIDGGVGRHGLPDRERRYSLERRERKSKPADDAIPLRVCTNEDCLHPYEAVLTKCPRCNTDKPLPKARSTPEQVDGDLVELDPEVLRELRGEAEAIYAAPSFPRNASPLVVAGIKNRHWDQQQKQNSLRDAISLWAGWQAHMGREDRETYRRFFFAFGIDIATAQTLGAKDASELEGRIRTNLTVNNITVKQT